MSEDTVVELHGTVQNGVIVIDDRIPLPEGTRVTIVVEAKNEQEENVTLRDRLLKLAGTVDDLPPDMARNHDRYIHGNPER
ncbi:MAG TPA: hypothetical protein VG826_03515 [Pirellulales bacterium]|nr:hypothetical protein [Pirellulales bacterium]